MKTLFALRHAKSSWDNINLSDFERPLNKRGLKTAPQMGEMMYRKNFHPKLIVSSPAKRAKQTAILIKEKLQNPNEIIYDERIYEASSLQLLRVISEFDDKADSIMLVGHNPGLENLIKTLTDQIQSMPTAALAVIDLNIEKWNETTQNIGTLRCLIRPKEDLENLRAEF